MHFLSNSLRHSIAVTTMGVFVGAILTLGVQHMPETDHLQAAMSSPVSEAIDARKELLTRSVKVFYTGDKGSVMAETEYKLSDYPQWLLFTAGLEGAMTATISTDEVRKSVEANRPSLPSGQFCTILSDWIDDAGITHAQTDCIAEEGYSFETDDVVEHLIAAIKAGESITTVPLSVTPATIRAQDGSPMTLLSTGRSDFSGSPLGRAGNVKKALSQHLHNIIVPADGTFSFLSMLGSTDTSNGWYMAYTIVNGGDLKYEPGGGICQVSTTLYRAALRAGLPIVQRANHSLYVSHYEKHGVGLDATIYTAKQDFRFKNDTGAPILIQAYYQGDEAFVHIFGRDDGRRVVMEGPFFMKTSPADVLGPGTSLKINEIGWKRTVTKAGEEVTESILSRYGAIPKTLAASMTTEVEVVKEGTISVVQN